MTNLEWHSEASNGNPVLKLHLKILPNVKFTEHSRKYLFENAKFKIEGKTLTISEGGEDIVLEYYDGPSNEKSSMQHVQSFPITNGGGCGWSLFTKYSFSNEQLPNNQNWVANLEDYDYDWHLSDDLVLYYTDIHEPTVKVRQIHRMNSEHDFRSMLKHVVGSMYVSAKRELFDTLKN